MPDMRFAPPNPLRIADRATGLNAISVRSYNERLLLSLLLQNETISRFEVGEKTGLSAQTVSVLVRSLEQEGLVSKGEAQKESGRVGPPTVPISLNPEGAFSVGIGIGFKSIEVSLIDFVGRVRFYQSLPNPPIDQPMNYDLVLQMVQKAISSLPAPKQSRIAGIGLALPEAGSKSGPQSGSTAAQIDDGRDYEMLQARIERDTGLDVFVQNDITSAAGGESMFGAAKPLSDYLFFYLGANLHNRLILNHQIHHGNSAISFDVGIGTLETQLEEKGFETSALWDRTSSWPDYGPEYGDAIQNWENVLIDQMISSVEAMKLFVEVNTIVVSSYAPQDVCATVCTSLEKRLDGIKAIAGSIHPSPKAIGAAGLSFSSRFMVDS